MAIGSRNLDKARVRKIAAATLIVLAVLAGVALWRAGILRQLSNKDQLIQLLRDGGIKGPLFCVAAQFAQVVIFVIPGEITQFAAGYVFGAWRGFVYSIIGILLGSAFNFYFARFFGRPVLEGIISPARLEQIDLMLAKARGKSAMFFLFLLPGAPKDALCYAAGLSHMTLPEFLVISGLGRLPALLASILFGSRLYHGDAMSMSLLALLGILFFLAFYWYERRRSRSPER